MKTLKSIYIHQRFFVYLSIIVVLFLISYWFPVSYRIAWVAVLILGVITGYDFFALFFSKRSFNASRNVPNKLSNSDKNQVTIRLHNQFSFPVRLSIIDELPIQFQERNFYLSTTLNPEETALLSYTVTPFERGEYVFGALNVYVSSALRIFKRQLVFDVAKKVAVYPSYLQMKKYEFLAMSNRLTAFGLKRIRRIGHTLEFEQIKNYVSGDDVRTVNWKATAKRGQLMVNQYQDERSQPIYTIIDISRTMKMPFNQLKLMDYAINSALAFSNIALLKNDKVGMITFSNTVANIIPASNKKSNLSILNEALYNSTTHFLDADFGHLNGIIKRKIIQRSLLLLYTNFEHISALNRQLLYLKDIAKKHLLVVIFFENTSLDKLIEKESTSLQSIYHKTIAEKFAYEKRLMVKELENAGIQAILTKPSELSVNVINKYIALKAKGLI